MRGVMKASVALESAISPQGWFVTTLKACRSASPSSMVRHSCLFWSLAVSCSDFGLAPSGDPVFKKATSD